MRFVDEEIGHGASVNWAGKAERCGVATVRVVAGQEGPPEVAGHMVVLVEKRRVLVACTFSEQEQKPQLLAAAPRFRAGG